MSVPDSFPRQQARTQRFTLGAPRNVTVAATGDRVAFLRSGGPEDPVTALWALDLPDGEERIVADPATLLAELVEVATAHGFHACMARIVGGHDASIALHLGCGFEVVGTEREVGRKFGQWLDVVLMERLLT